MVTPQADLILSFESLVSLTNESTCIVACIVSLLVFTPFGDLDAACLGNRDATHGHDAGKVTTTVVVHISYGLSGDNLACFYHNRPVVAYSENTLNHENSPQAFV